MPEKSWNGRTLLITGASRGIGAALSRLWLQKGANVIPHSSRDATLTGTGPPVLAQGILGAEKRLTWVTSDASVPGAMGAMFRDLLHRGSSIDAVLFNHGTTVFNEGGRDIVVAPPWAYSPHQMSRL